MDALTPYAGTSGWSGSSTSETRARQADGDGTTARRQQWCLRMADRHGATGVTVKEIRGWGSLHHGQASSLLSVLHKEGRLARLSEVRDRCKVYVLPEYVGGREIEPPGRTRGSQAVLDAERRRIQRRLDLWLLEHEDDVRVPVALTYREFSRIVEDASDHAG